MPRSDPLVVYFAQDLLQVLLEIEIILERILGRRREASVLSRDSSLKLSIGGEMVQTGLAAVRGRCGRRAKDAVVLVGELFGLGRFGGVNASLVVAQARRRGR